MVRNLSSHYLVSIMAHSRKRSSKKNSRSLRLESLERRNLLAGDVFHNYLSPSDVNNDNQVSAVDALTVINHLNHLNHLRRTEASGEGEQVGSSAFADVNDDGRTSAIDALMAINQLNREARSLVATGGELEARITGASGERAKVQFENEYGGIKLEVKIQNALPGESYDVIVGSSVVATLVTNSRGRASLETFLTGAEADTLAAANAGTSVSISGIGASVFGGEQSDDDNHGEHNDHDNDVDGHEDSDHDGSDGHDDIDHGSSSDTNSNESDSDDGLNISGNSDSSGDSDDSSGDVVSGSSSVESNGNDTGSNDSDSIDDVDHGLNGSSDSDDGAGHVNDDASGDFHSDNDDVPVTPSVPGTAYGEWKARLTGTGSGKAEFEIERGEMEFEVEVQGFAANSTYPVSVGGVVIGQLRTNSRGKGELKFEIGDDDHRPFPANFPTITAGTSVSVGDQVSGVFAAKINDHDRDDHDDDHDD
ncbi:Dockerin type I repeat protein [Rubripirellula tenax]|uniref:Dockerin type I repeat protein n=1 Tax=Rubripirellula tenax TaxID=2528015 RepID=A0A5C6EBS4_9BACT|nr:dockerin type I domain-containing protein [Rubripirellula tenax]TWU44589.1 Dockerin type I repeat protein [Rubripirellula tenax]